MNSAELKLEIFRIIDCQEEAILKEIYESLINQFKQTLEPKPMPVDGLDPIEAGYKAMAVDKERELKAMEWIEGVANFEEL